MSKFLKKSIKSKVSSDLNDFKNPDKYKLKRQRAQITKIDYDNGPTTSDDLPKQMQYTRVQGNKKKAETITNVTFIDSQKKMLDMMEKQINTRKEVNEKLNHSLSAVLSQIEVDAIGLEENRLKIQKLTMERIKFMQEANVIFKQRLGAIKEIQSSFKEQCEDFDITQNSENKRIADELTEDFKVLLQKQFSETHRSEMNKLQKLVQAMQNDF